MFRERGTITRQYNSGQFTLLNDRGPLNNFTEGETVTVNHRAIGEPAKFGEICLAHRAACSIGLCDEFRPLSSQG